jgi:hypothetical protein
MMLKDLQVTSLESVFAAVGSKSRTPIDACLWLGRRMSTSINFKKASYIIGLSMISILLGRVPSTYDEIDSVKGCGPKVTREALKEGFGIVDGIGADVHMCRIFGVCDGRWAMGGQSQFLCQREGQVVEPINNTGRQSKLCHGGLLV